MKKTKQLVIEPEEGVDHFLNFFKDAPLTVLDLDKAKLERKSENKQEPTEQSFIKQTQIDRIDDSRKSADRLVDRQIEQTIHNLNNKKQKLRSKQPKKSKIIQNNTLKQQRVFNICRNIIKKIKRNNIYSQPLTQQEIQKFQKEEQLHGIQLGQNAHQLWDLFGSLVMITLLFSQSFVLVFSQIEFDVGLKAIMSLGIIFFCGQIFLNLIMINRSQGRKITILRDIIKHYTMNQFLLDLLVLIFLCMLVFTQNDTFNNILISIYILKLPNLIAKLERLQKWIFKSFYYERYWSLFKIMLFNLTFAHAIAILLNLMASMQPGANWQIVRGIQHAPWFQKYVWSYYWATTIMLTVGFGDIVPSNYHEAIWVIFIEIISCIAFSYNISCLGNLIGSIRAQGEMVSKNHKIFQNLAVKCRLSQELIDKVEHYIDESVNVKLRFNIAQEKNFIQHLPQGYKKQVLCETNRNMLKILPFFGRLMQKTISKLSQYIERNIYFPEQTIKSLNSNFKIFILQKGQIGYICKRPGSLMNGTIVNTVIKKQKDLPFLTHFNFITLVKCNYEIKSLGYSIVHTLTYQNFVSALDNFKKDYQYYCFLRDRSKHIIDQYQTVDCERCNSKHTNFQCPKFHYIPIKEHVIHKKIAMQRQQVNEREVDYERMKRVNSNALTFQKHYFKTIKGFINQEMLQTYDQKRRKQKIFMQTSSLIESQHHKPNLSILIPSTDQQNNFFEFVSDMVSHTISKQLKTKQQIMQDEVWDLACDCIFDYDLYFPDSNISSVALKHKKHRLLKLKGEDKQLKQNNISTFILRQFLN